VLSVEIVERLEFEIARRGPVEAFFREFVLVCECNAHTHVVIGFGTLDAAPEK